MRYAIFTTNSWWRGVTQDDRVFFFVREAPDDDNTFMDELDPEKKYRTTYHIVKLDDNDFLKIKFNIDKAVIPIS